MAASLRWLCNVVARIARGAAAVLAVVMLVALSLQVVMRYLFGWPLSWSEELAVSCFGWAMLLAIAVGVREGAHVRMDLLTDQLPPVLQTAMARLVACAIAFVGGFLAWSGWNYAADSSGLTSAAMAYPLTWLNAAAPACGALMALFGLEQAVLGPPAPPPPSASGSGAPEATTDGLAG